jgi:periplasmic protein TonB
MRDSGRDQTVTSRGPSAELRPEFSADSPEPPLAADHRRPNKPPARRRIASGAAVSLVLHAVVLALLLVRLKWDREPEPLPPPSTVDMVFEGGRPEGPSTPEPTPVPVPSTARPSDIGGAPGGAAPPPPPEAAQPSPSEPQPVPPAEAPPKLALAPSPEPPPPLVVPPPPVLPSPPVVQPPPPTEPGPAEITVPPPPPPVPAQPPAPQTPAQKQTWPPMRQQPTTTTTPSTTPNAAKTTPRHPSDFPAPMDFSFGPPTAPGVPTPGRPILSLGLPRRGPEDSAPFSLETNAEVGPDWRNALSEWVHEHAYYPEQAAELGQEGTTRVLVKTMPGGHVLSVEMEKRSGSPWLDLALEGLFRGAKLPPMPRSAGDEPVEFHFTMHYIIVR